MVTEGKIKESEREGTIGGTSYDGPREHPPWSRGISPELTESQKWRMVGESQG